MPQSAHPYQRFVQTMLIFFLAFVYEFWLLHPSVPVATRAVTATNSQQVFALWFGVSVLVAVILVAKVQAKYTGSLFVIVITASGLMTTLFYTLINMVSQTWAFGLSLVLTVVVLLMTARFPLVIMRNAVVLLATIGLARVFGLQFAPQSMALVAGVAAGYAWVSSLAKKESTLMPAQVLGVQTIGFTVPNRWFEWMQPIPLARNADMVAALDLLLPLSIAVSFGAYVSSQSFSVAAIAALFGLMLVFRLRPFLHAVPSLAVIVGCSIIGVYFFAQ